MATRYKNGKFIKGVNPGTGVQFTSENQPLNSGRKPSRFKQLIQNLSTNGEEIISREDYNNVISHLLTLTPDELKKVASDATTPIAVIIIASSIAGDIESKNLTNTEKLIDRIFGKEPIKGEISGGGIKIVFENNGYDRT